MSDDSDADLVVRVLIEARRQGASCRSLAKLAGVSKSTMGRWLSALDAAASQVGQCDGNSPPVSDDDSADLSQMGQREKTAS
jgi:transposase